MFVVNTLYPITGMILFYLIITGFIHLNRFVIAAIPGHTKPIGVCPYLRFTYVLLYFSKSRHCSGNGTIRKKFLLQKPRWEEN